MRGYAQGTMRCPGGGVFSFHSFLMCQSDPNRGCASEDLIAVFGSKARCNSVKMAHAIFPIWWTSELFDNWSNTFLLVSTHFSSFLFVSHRFSSFLVKWAPLVSPWKLLPAAVHPWCDMHQRGRPGLLEWAEAGADKSALTSSPQLLRRNFIVKISTPRRK